MKLIVLVASLFMAFSVFAKDRFADIQIKTVKVSGNVYMLTGAGGNIGVLATEQGLLLVDDQFLPLAQRIEKALATLTEKPQSINYLVNTHYHGDHTGGNEYFAKQATIFAHHNVRKRLMVKEGLAPAALPVVTYEQGVTIHLGDEKVLLTHLPNGHTDGDTIVYFKNSNVLHTGDQLFASRFPYVDLKSGGSVVGYMNNLQALITMLPDDIKVIPGHGELTDKDGLKDVVEMIEHSISTVKLALKNGQSAEQIIEAGLGEKYKNWGVHFINEQRWLETVISEFIKQ